MRGIRLPFTRARPLAAPRCRALSPPPCANRQNNVVVPSPSLPSPLPIFSTPSSQRRSLHGGVVPVDPVTPDVHQVCSKRAFDGQVRKWRRMLHAWDPPEGEEEGGGADARSAPSLTSPGAGKRGASARTPATAGRRTVGRKEDGKGGEGKGEASSPPARRGAFDDWVDAAGEVGP